MRALINYSNGDTSLGINFERVWTRKNKRGKVIGYKCYINDFRNNDNLIAVGKSKCNKLDVFDKIKGQKLALLDALNQTALSKEQRKEIWNEYFKKVKK